MLTIDTVIKTLAWLNEHNEFRYTYRCELAADRGSAWTCRITSVRPDGVEFSWSTDHRGLSFELALAVRVVAKDQAEEVLKELGLK